MCWSAEADLATGAVVTCIGVACLARVRRPRDLPLAALPLLLGFHQLIEAAVWLGEDGRIGAGPAGVARTAWAVIALPGLAALVPVGVWCAAGPGQRRPRHAVLAVIGVAIAAVLAVSVLAHPVTAETHGHTLSYAVGVPAAPLLTAGYLLATVGSLLLSGDRTLRLLGWLVGAAAAVCTVLWQLAFASTWCALAALVSVVLLSWTRRP